MSDFGPEYHKIDSLFKRDEKGRIIPADFSRPEFEYLSGCDWRWTEKVDGTNIRVHYNGHTVTIGGRTDNAQIPTFLLTALEPLRDVARFDQVFDQTESGVTLYGEGYGAKIQKGGGLYRPDNALVLFDVRIGDWFLRHEDVANIAQQFGLEVVPTVAIRSVPWAWQMVAADQLESAWPGARIEGLVGVPTVELKNRSGHRVITKLKVKDFADYRAAA